MTVITSAPEYGPGPPVEPPDAWEYTLQVPHDPLGPTVARSTIRTVLARHGLPELVDVAELLASELVTNAYRYSVGPASVRLKWTHGTLRIGVWDTNPNLPSPVPANPDSEGGRGLMLVRICADSWGRYPLGQRQHAPTGKVVWFEIREPVAAAA